MTHYIITIYNLRNHHMSLTAALINSAPSYPNYFGQMELNLRRQSLSTISNTAATLNFFECIDLSENAIQTLGNFSYLDRVKTINASSNIIKMIHGLGAFLPNLQNLILMTNRIEDFSEIFNLGACKRLKRLVLLGNPVTEKPNYRFFTIFHIESLKTLDFKKITKEQRELARKIIGKVKK